MASPAEDASSHSNHSFEENAAHTPVSLAQRAPTGPIATRIWHMYVWYGLSLIEYRSLLEQRNQCVRSRVAHLSLTHRHGLQAQPQNNHIQLGGMGQLERNVEVSTFPYPNAFIKLVVAASRARGTTRENDEENRVEDSENVAATSGQTTRPQGFPRLPVISEWSPPGPRVEREQKSWVFGISNSWFGVTRTSVIESETKAQPLYIVVGIFPRGHSSPRERIVFVRNPNKLFWKLGWAVFRLRGLRSTFFSLRHVKSFRLYKCDPENGTHEHVDLDRNGAADLQLLLHQYKSWYTSSYISRAWANWMHQTLNNESYNVLKGAYSLELVLGWSVTRISFVVLLPVLLSLAIGLWLNAKNWTDLATIQTAWGTASYVVTAGGLLAALLGILSSISDN